MNNANGVSRGDRNRNARLSRLRELVPTANAIVGIDLADKKQMVVVTDHDSKVLARRPAGQRGRHSSPTSRPRITEARPTAGSQRLSSAA